ncbi:MAG: hypothetical protein R3B48_27285 [Kofleriaceae bacterium]
MRRPSIALVLSTVAHAALGVALRVRGPAEARSASVDRAPTTIEIVTVARPEAEAIDLWVLPAELAGEALPAPAPPAPLALTSPARAPARAAITAGRTAEVSAGRAGEAAPAGGSADRPGEGDRGALGMRGLLPRRLVMPDLQAIAQRGERPLAPRPRDSGDLVAAGGGRLRSDQGSFTAAVAADGSVELRDAPNLRVRFALPSVKAAGEGLARWYEDPYARTRDPERQPLPSGVVDDAEEQRKRPETVPLISGGFDTTDWIARMAGRDPYWSAKLGFLDRTREQRAEMARNYRAELLRGADHLMRDHARRIWAEPGQSAAARRRALFELWDECTESGEAVEVEASGRARAAVIAFIRAHLPADGPQGYSSIELAKLNRRRHSQQVFAPYLDASSDSSAPASPDGGEPPTTGEESGELQPQ